LQYLSGTSVQNALKAKTGTPVKTVAETTSPSDKKDTPLLHTQGSQVDLLKKAGLTVNIPSPSDRKSSDVPTSPSSDAKEKPAEVNELRDFINARLSMMSADTLKALMYEPASASRSILS
jgi:hypothetical protein